MTIIEQLESIIGQYRAGYLVLVDPDRIKLKEIPSFAQRAQSAGVDGVLLGGSFLTNDLSIIAETLKKSTDLPIILFPGSAMQVTPHADAILFMSLLSGRNANYLIGEQVKAAPMIQRVGLETISTGYILIDGGQQTAVSFISNTTPIPNDKAEIAWAHALAAQYLGMKLIYLEAGSGAKKPVPDQIIHSVKKQVTVPIIVGGGIRSPEVARKKVAAGAQFVVTGNVIEQDPSLMAAFADAIHS
ncbi:MAG: geranylgeranylglyceryl/heptaprenylglyceryl phosphate synthase [Candidatus Poribacteria bacterium]|nr:geranylgeranylglyceryl/heptaprenylglyceryl phosphate synthase [Candidatus Poribacteria bacterium]|tara:strand:+ start:67 stop:798 length:732 start_codon:yes stop_codon:yes gene_type:complete